MPTSKEINNMWSRNRDGAGIMYAIGGKVHIEKGFMEYADFVERIDQLDDIYGLKNLALVMHFRITTHGGTSAECTHPFPITDSMGMLRKLNHKTTIGVAHNGIIPGCSGGKDFSDTMEYIAGQLAPLYKAVPKFYENKHLMQMIKAATESKLAFLTSDGKIYTVGKFFEHNGIMYSNTSYEHMNTWRDYDYSKWSYSGGWENGSCLGRITAELDLMWLDDAKGEYVVDEKGQFAYSGEYAIDSYNYVYVYNYDEDAFVACYQYKAYNCEGMALKFNPNAEYVTKELVVY